LKKYVVLILILTTVTLLLTSPPTSANPSLDVDYVGSYWNTHVAYDGSESLSLNVVLISYERDTIRNIYATAHLFEGAYSKDHTDTITIYYDTPVNYGDMFTLTFPNIYLENVKPGYHTVKVDVKAHVYSGGSIVTKTTTIYALVYVSKYTSVLKIASLEWMYNGEHVVPLPGSSNIVFRIKLYNKGDYTIGSIVATVSLPKGISLISQEGTCSGELGPGRLCNLDLYLNISEHVKPGNYNMNLALTYQIRDGGAQHLVRDSYTVEFRVNDPETVDTKLNVTVVSWGSGPPQAAYPASKNVPLTMTITNNGRYSVSNVLVSTARTPSGILPVNNVSICATTLPILSQCTTQLFFDIEPFVEPGIYNITLNISYILPYGGALIQKEKRIVVSVPVEQYAGLDKDKRLFVVDYGWQNGWPVYPNTEKAVYTVTFANRLPYAISGIVANMSLPRGFTNSGGKNFVVAYVPGPVSSEQTFAIQFEINVGDVSSGTYMANLTVSYVVETGRSKYLLSENHTLPLNVKRSGDVEFVTSFWIEGSSGPGDYGKTLYVVFRNNNVPTMEGVIGNFILPKGFIITLTNSSEALLAPLSAGNIPQMVGNVPRNIQDLVVSALVGGAAQAAVQTSISEGEFIVFSIPVGISNNVKPGIYEGTVILNFIDQWGNVRELNETFTIPVFGNVRLIKIVPPYVYAEVKGTNTTFTIELVNVGSGKIENIYAIAYSATPYVVVGDPVRYVGELRPNGTRKLTYTLYFNPTLPQNIPLGGAVPVIITVSYREPQGLMRTVNQTVVVVLTPTIDLKIFDVSYEPIESGIRVSGILANLGAAVARNVELEVYIGNASGYSLIGDIDPSTQMSFSVDVPFKGNASEITFKIRYKDYFYSEKTVKQTLPMTIVGISETVTTPAVQQPVLIDIYRVAVIVLVGAFLASIVIILRSYVKRRWRT